MEFSTKDWEEMRLLAKYKQLALVAGTKLMPFSSFSIQTKLGSTTFPKGKFMEIVMAWMLGYFRRISGVALRVSMTATLDKHGIDFELACGDETATVNMKFDREAYSDNADTDTRYDYCIRTWIDPDVAVKECKSRNHLETGCEALSEMVATVVRAKFIKNVLSEHPDVVAIFNDVWRNYSGGWD